MNWIARSLIFEKQIAEAKKNKEDVATIKELELELTMLKKQVAMNDGLLDSPAIVLSAYQQYNYLFIFTTEAEGGNMLVTENTDYVRKDS